MRLRSWHTIITFCALVILTALVLVLAYIVILSAIYFSSYDHGSFLSRVGSALQNVTVTVLHSLFPATTQLIPDASPAFLSRAESRFADIPAWTIHVMAHCFAMFVLGLLSLHFGVERYLTAFAAALLPITFMFVSAPPLVTTEGLSATIVIILVIFLELLSATCAVLLAKSLAIRRLPAF